MNNQIIFDTAFISLIVQFITGIVGSIGIFVPLNKKDSLLTDVIIIETIVQFIEFIFYIWLVYSVSSKTMNITSIRYIDWSLTTPMMLISTILYFSYTSQKEEFKDAEGNITLNSILKKDYKIILLFCLSNLMMLFFGVLGELDIIDRYVSFILSTFFFLITFKIIYDYYVELDDSNKPLFYVIFSIWALYGVAFLFNYRYRNSFYNILDIFSKNFYGLFIFYKIYQKKIN